MLNPSELMQAFDITEVPWHYAGNVVDPVTGESQNYQQLIKNPKTQERWSLGMCYELDSAPPPRVGAAETSTNPTLPRVVKSTPRVETHHYSTH